MPVICALQLPLIAKGGGPAALGNLFSISPGFLVSSKLTRPVGLRFVPVLQLLLIAKEEDLKPTAAVFKAFRETGLANKGKLVLVTVNLDGPSKDPVVNFFGVKAEDAPMIVGFEMEPNKKFKLKGDIT